ncbi:MAG: hypothetical protein ACRCVV_14695 [Shewanella sp.]|uniref:hypothetical protein n=1 Tax=Aeromonas popoffii TaxID=70856 RepID=UPI003F343035
MQITTLEQAARHLMDVGAVDMNTMTVEGKQLLEVCGYEFGKDQKKFLDRIVDRHEFEINKDFTIDIVVDGNIKRNAYRFTMNAANHALLAAMTEKGKVARQQAIDMKEAVDSVPMEMVERMMASLADKLTERAGAEIAKLAHSKDSEIKDRNELIIRKSQPVSLTKILGNSHKVVQAANLWLEEAGYQTVRFKDGKRNGWTITDEGRELGAQVSESSIFWVPDIKQVLPPVSELLDYAERLGLKDMKKMEVM